MSLSIRQLAPYGIPAYHPRTTWEPHGTHRATDFNRQPPRQNVGDVSRGAVHYTAAINLPDGDPGEILDGVDGIRQLLARSHLDYLKNRTGGGYRSTVTGIWYPGYPLGYSWGFDWLGGVWEIAGLEYRPAATSSHNSYTKAFLVLTDRADEASAAMLRSVRGMMRFLRDQGAPIENRPWAHGWFRERTGSGTATACCGSAVKGQINEGLLDIDYDDTGGTVSAPIPLRKPKRAYDSRPGQRMDSPYDVHNGHLPRTPVQPGQPRKVWAGLANTVEVNLTVIGSGRGYAEVTSSPDIPTTSLVNYSPEDRLESNTGTVRTDAGGNIYVHCSVSPADVIVDIRGQFPES